MLPAFSCTMFEPDGSGMTKAASEFVELLARFARQDEVLIAGLRRNREVVESIFPADPWRELLKSMNAVVAKSDDVSPKSD